MSAEWNLSYQVSFFNYDTELAYPIEIIVSFKSPVFTEQPAASKGININYRFHLNFQLSVEVFLK